MSSDMLCAFLNGAIFIEIIFSQNQSLGTAVCNIL